MDTTDIHNDFKRILTEFQREVIPMLRNNLTQQSYRYTDRLYGALNINLNETGNESWELDFDMPDYGFTLNSKKPFAHNASAEDLARWVSFIGLDKFQNIPGYNDSNFVPAQAAERIAWAIIMSKPKAPNRMRSFAKPLSYQWFYRPFFGMWAERRDTLLEVYFDKLPEKVIGEVRGMYQSAVSKMGRPVAR